MTSSGRQAGRRAAADVNEAYGRMMSALRDDPAAQAIAIGEMLRRIVGPSEEKPFIEIARRDRRHSMNRLHDAGSTVEDIADLLGMSKGRVRQILRAPREADLKRSHGRRSRGPIANGSGVPDAA